MSRAGRGQLGPVGKKSVSASAAATAAAAPAAHDTAALTPPRRGARVGTPPGRPPPGHKRDVSGEGRNAPFHVGRVD